MLRKIAAFVRTFALFGGIALLIAATTGLTWLRWESHQPREDWFGERRGNIEDVTVADSVTANGQLSAFVTLRWTDGRHIRPGRNQVVEDLLRIADEELPLPSIGVSRDR